jgi:MoaA/NifB/PqqE/SkfB family radical SAM enzyme
MNREWSNPYNSFNSYKGLLYRKQFDGILEGKLLPPVEVNIDPVNNCNLDCIWCNGKNIIAKDKKVMMTPEHLIELVDFCGSWGVKAICFAGGGEPTLHPKLHEAIERVVFNDMEVALITNGLFTSYDQKFAAAKFTRWCGISVDAATPSTYEKVKKANRFDEVIKNIENLVSIGIKELTFKFLIHPHNQSEIFNACMLAKELGCSVFHSRILSSKYVEDGAFDYKLIDDQLMRCMEIADDKNFKVYAIRHKQEGDGNRRIRFKECKASPLLCMMEANGDVGLCIDRKGDPLVRLCSHENVEELRSKWGSQEHLDMLSRICPEKDCKKCTMTIYQELLDAYGQDAFCVNFP